MRTLKKTVLIGMLALSNGAFANLDTGLVAYYCFDDSTNIGKDCSSNGNNGFIEGNVTYTNGIKNGAGSFGGIENPSDIHIPNSPSLQFTNALTFSYFVKLNSFEGMDGYSNIQPYGSHAVIAKDHDWHGFVSRIDTIDTGTSSIGFVNDFWNNYESTGISLPTVQLKKWVHVALVVVAQKNGKVLVSNYLNGKLKSKSTNAFKTLDFSTANSEDLYIGKYSDSWYPLNGLIDEVRFYNRELSPNEINNIYNQVIPSVSLGGTVTRLDEHTITCLNNATKQSIIISATKVTNYDCESNGLKVKPTENITITINGNVK
jgi:hypothetical protein